MYLNTIMTLVPYRYRFVRHIALAGSEDSLPFGFWLKKYKCLLFKDYSYHTTDRHLAYIERRLNKIVYPDEPTLVQYVKEQLDLLEEYIQEKYIQPLLQHIREERYVERMEIFLRDKFEIECEEYYVQCREYYELYKEYREYYAYHLHDYYVNSIYYPTLHSRALISHCLEIADPYIGPYIRNPYVDFALISLAFLSRIVYFLPIPWEYPPVDLSTSDLKLFSHTSPEELKWWQQIGFNINRTLDLYGYYSQHLPYF